MTNGVNLGASVEPPEHIDAAIRILREIEADLGRMDGLPLAMPGSVLAEEDRLNPLEPGSHLARSYDDFARDNLQTAMRTAMAAIDGDTELPAFAIYSQLRGSLESAAWGYWLLMNSQKATRLYRSLSITYGHAADFQDTLKNLGMTWPAELRFERLNEIKDSIPALRQKALTGPPRTTAVLREVARSAPGVTMSPLNSWKLCSGMAHASRPVIFNLSERVPIGAPDQNGSVPMILRARIGWLATIAREASTLMTTLRKRYVDLATHDYAGRPLQVDRLKASKSNG